MAVGGTKLAQMFAEIDLDRTKYDKALDDIVVDAGNATTKIETSWKKLGVKTEGYYSNLRSAINKHYKSVLLDTELSANERLSIEMAYTEKIKGYFNQQYKYALKYQQEEIRLAEEKYKILMAIEEAKLNNQKARIVESNALAQNQINAQQKVENERARIAQLQIASEESLKNYRENNWKNLGIRSQEEIQKQINNVQKSATEIQSTVQRGSQNWINVENAKNAKLKQLNAEMVGDHEVSMASMARAVLRFYAVFYVGAAALTGVKDFFMSGVKAIDEFKTNTIAVAAQITSMQGTTGNVAENYKKNVEYAKALIPILMQIDAQSFANFQQISLMNRAATNHGVILDINNKKQIEGFTAVTNTVALLTTGQNKEIQASQEINALTTGRVRATDMVAMSIDAIIKQEGKYKGGLAEVVKLSKEHNDLWERLAPYMAGVAAAAGDISQTWEAVSSSAETAWGIIQRALFKDVYKDLTRAGRDAVQWMKTNADSIVESITAVKDAVVFSIEVMIAAFAVYEVASIGATIKSGKAWSSFSVIWDQLTTAISFSTSKMTLAFGVFTAALAGWEIGQILNKFEIVRKAGVYAVYGIINAWEWLMKYIRIGMEYMADPLGKNGRDARIAAIKSQYETEKQVRAQYEKDQLEDVTDAAIARAKAEENAKKTIETPQTKSSIANQTKDSVKADQEALQNRIKADKYIYDEAVKSADQLAKLQRERGRDEYQVINDLYENKRFLLNQYLETEYKNAEEEVALSAKSATLTKDGVAKKYDAMKVLQSKYDEIYAQYSKNWQKTLGEEAIATEEAKNKTISTMAALYSTIAQYSQDSIDLQIKLLERKYVQEGRYTQGSLALAIALKAEENKLYENADNFWADYYSKIDGYADVYYQKKLSWIERIRQAEISAANATKKSEAEKNIEISAANAKANQAIINAIGERFDQDNKYTKQAITNAGSVLDAAMTCYDKDSYEYNRLAEWKKAVQIAELAMTAAKNAQIIAGYFAVSAGATAAAVSQNAANTSTAITGAASSIAAQGTVPYAGFAMAAAMLAFMASVLGMAGIAFGGGSSASASVPILPKSTVLGAENGTASESIQKSWELMQDTYDMEDTKLTNIYNELRDLNSNITGLVTNIVKYGMNASSWVVPEETGTALSSMSGNFASNLLGVISASFGDILSVMGMGKFGDKVASFVSSVFGGGTSSSLAESGISINATTARDLINGLQVAAQQYALIVTTHYGGWFSSDWWSRAYQYADLDSSVTGMFTKVFRGISQTLVSLAESLGMDTQAALNYTFSNVNINLQGMTTDEISETITNYFSSLGDTAVETLFGSILRQYQELGEGLYETAVRVITDKETILYYLGIVNNAYSATSLEAIAMSENLINLAGDLDTLTGYIDTYYDKFFSDAEKQIDLYNSLTSSFASMNYMLPATRDGYRAIVEGLDLTTASGQSAYVTLMALSEYADSYYSYLEDEAETAADKIADLVDELESLSTTISEWLASLGISELNPVLSEQSYKNQYANLLAAAQAPSATSDAITDYLNYATTFLTYEKSYGTSGSYQAIYEAVVADVMAIQAKNNAALASYDSGTDFVPETGLYKLHRGEIVSTKADSIKKLGESIGEYILSSNGGSTGGDIHVSVQIDGKEIGNVVARQTRTNSDLQKSIRSLN